MKWSPLVRAFKIERVAIVGGEEAMLASELFRLRLVSIVIVIMMT